MKSAGRRRRRRFRAPAPTPWPRYSTTSGRRARPRVAAVSGPACGLVTPCTAGSVCRYSLRGYHHHGTRTPAADNHRPRRYMVLCPFKSTADRGD